MLLKHKKMVYNHLCKILKDWNLQNQFVQSRILYHEHRIFYKANKVQKVVYILSAYLHYE